jgi:putative phage endonuclease
MKYEFEVEGKIVGKERPRVNMYSGNVYTPTKTKDYETLIQQAFLIKYRKQPRIEGRLSVSIIAFFKIPTSIKKSDRELMINDVISPTKKPDVDNIAKVVLDGLNNFVFKDDNQVSKIFVEKKYTDDTEKIFISVEEY